MTDDCWQQALANAGPDPLRILSSTAAVMQTARDVRIDRAAVDTLAGRLIASAANPTWDADLHVRLTGTGGDERTAMWILVLDALNFCFWAQGDDPSVRWRVQDGDVLVDGYVALTVALKHAMASGIPIADPRWLATVPDTDVASLLAPANGHPAIPLLDCRVANLRELGRGLLIINGDSPASALIRSANGSAMTLVREIVQRFPSFDDTASWPLAGTGLPNNEVRFYKRAQILVGDLAGGLSGSELASFADLDHLTAFADYKVPQVLRALEVLVYNDSLSRTIANRDLIPAGDPREIEIRSATVWGCELLRQAMLSRGRDATAHELDWLLWTEGQSLPMSTPPYHRTVTQFY